MGLGIKSRVQKNTNKREQGVINKILFVKGT